MGIQIAMLSQGSRLYRAREEPRSDRLPSIACLAPSSCKRFSRFATVFRFPSTVSEFKALNMTNSHILFIRVPALTNFFSIRMNDTWSRVAFSKNRVLFVISSFGHGNQLTISSTKDTEVQHRRCPHDFIRSVDCVD
jgi:hypothetical protein